MTYKFFILSLFLVFSSQFERQANIYNSNTDPIEQLEYSLHYGIFRVGKARISYTLADSSCGYKLYAEARTTGLAKLFRRLCYSFDCCMDIERKWPLSTKMYFNEKNYHIQNQVIFDHESRPDSTIVYSQNSGQTVVKKGIYDVLSDFYYFRKDVISENMEIEKYMTIETYFWDEVYDLKIKYMGNEMIKSNFGQIDCLKVNPRTDIGRFFRTNDDMSIWFTNDKDHIPVKLIIDLKFGTIKAHLTKQVVEDRL